MPRSPSAQEVACEAAAHEAAAQEMAREAAAHEALDQEVAARKAADHPKFAVAHEALEQAVAHQAAVEQVAAQQEAEQAAAQQAAAPEVEDVKDDTMQQEEVVRAAPLAKSWSRHPRQPAPLPSVVLPYINGTSGWEIASGKSTKEEMSLCKNCNTLINTPYDIEANKSSRVRSESRRTHTYFCGHPERPFRKKQKRYRKEKQNEGSETEPGPDAGEGS